MRFFQIRNILLHECNVVYECRVCLSLFRSVGNLVAHKRDYCHHAYRDVKHVYRRDPGEFSGQKNSTAAAAENSDDDDEDNEPTTAYVQPEPIDTIVPEAQWDLGQ